MMENASLDSCTQKKKDSAMKTRSLKRFSLCFFIILLGICMFPVPVRAEEQIILSSFEELKEACAGTTNESGSFLCTSAEFVISEDFELPSYMTITFRNFTVQEGVTLTVEEHAEVRTYGFTVRGNLKNWGRIVQQDLSEKWADEEIEIVARIPGHVENKGEMILTDVFGTRNINRFPGKLVMYESESYREKLRIASGAEDPTPEIEVINTPSPTPAPLEKGTAHRIFDILENVIPKLAFFLVLVGFFSVVIVGITSARKEKQRNQGTAFADASDLQSIRNEPDRKTASDLIYNSSGEDHFQRDKRKRIEQLDDWLKNGLIDRKEYNELKRRYREDR